MLKRDLKDNLYKGSSGFIYYRKMIGYARIILPTHTKDVKTANKLHPALEYQALHEYYNPTEKTKFLSFKNLVEMYLSHDHEWTKDSRKMTEGALYGYLKRGVPENKNAAVIVKQRVNTCINWGIKNDVKTDQIKFEKVGQSIPRVRVFNEAEMNLILNDTLDEDFRSFVQFAYYTGARRGELENMEVHKFKSLYFETHGKTGRRLIRLNQQARTVLSNKEGMWTYKGEYISKRFKKNLRRMEIKDGRFHDLRRTFGYNLIAKHNVPIYKVSKLLGHKSVSTTEKHYAPLLVTDVEDFML